jgi:AcrR family transcriptional regulator
MSRSHQNSPRSATRNPERSRERILAAALREFAAKGFAGARVDFIARRAAINKRMLYHYFGNKVALFSAVLRQKMGERRAWAAGLSSDPAERLPFWFATACSDADWVRLLEWESLQSCAGKVIDEKERRAASADWLRRLRARQRRGELSGAFDAAHLALAMQSLTLFPAAFPQLVRLTTGQSIHDPRFQSAYRKFLKSFAAAFRQAAENRPKTNPQK